MSKYVYVYRPDHPKAGKGGMIPEHIDVAERALGKHMPPKAQVHHVNEDKSDNRPENLVVCQDQEYHSLLHVRAKALTECGDASKRKCIFCHQYDAPQNMIVAQKRARANPIERLSHRECRNSYYRGLRRGK